MSEEDLLERWNKRHAEAPDLGQVATVLEQNIHLVRQGAHALDLACGRGANALFMAQAGLAVTAWDLSPVAIKRLSETAEKERLTIEAGVRDVILNPPPQSSFDLVLVSFFLHRALAPAISQALKPGGLLFYQTFGRAAVTDEGPSSPEYRLGDNELLGLFEGLKVRVYREERLLGDTTRGWRDLVMLVAEKV